MKPKYPLSMFFAGVLLNITRLWLLDIVALILLILGLFDSSFSKWGLLLAAAILLISVIRQIIYRHILLTNPDFEELIGKDGDVQENIMKFVEKQMQSQAQQNADPDSGDTDETEEYPEDSDKE